MFSKLHGNSSAIRLADHYMIKFVLKAADAVPIARELDTYGSK